MQRLERALHDLAEQDERLDTKDVIAGIEHRLMVEASRSEEPVRSRVRHPFTVGAVAAAAAIVLVGAVPLVWYLVRSGENPSVVDELPATTQGTNAPSPTTAATPQETTAAPQPGTTEPPIDTVLPGDAAPGPSDYRAAGTPAGSLDTALGGLSWYTLRGVSFQWIEAGFPGPYGAQPDRDFWQIWNDTPGGLEIFETEAGYLALGSTTGPGEPRIMLGYRDNLARLRGAGTRSEVEQWDAERGVDGMEVWANGRWWDWGRNGASDTRSFFFAPDEVWYSTDGSDWRQIETSGFGDGVAVESQPGSVAYHDGTWMMIGRTGVEAPLGFVEDVGGSPAAWVSDDLVTWTRVPFDFASAGTEPRLLQVAGGDRGWLVLGDARFDGDRPTWETSIWASPDGITWEEIRIEDLTGMPGCPRWVLVRRDEVCHTGARAAFVPGGVAFYVDHTLPGQTTAGWTLWLGVWEE